MTTYSAREGQSLFDIALQLYGDAQYILQICVDNNISLDADIYAFQPIVFDESIFMLNNSTLYLALNGVNIVSADLETNPENMIDHSEFDYTFEDHN